MPIRLMVILSIALCVLGAVANARASYDAPGKPVVRHARTAKPCLAANRVINTNSRAVMEAERI